MKLSKQILVNILLPFTMLWGGDIAAQGAAHPFYTSGNKILDLCGNEFVIRGVNYSLLDDWDFPGNMNNGELSAQIIQANPNTVRIQWYADYGQAGRPAYTLTDLDSVISRFRRAGIVSMVELHDVTCTNDMAAFNNNVLTWWTSPAVVALIEKHKTHFMLNFANEFGTVNWDGNPAAAYTTWLNHYKAAITSVRAAGIDVPLVVDGPDCGISLDRVLLAGNDLRTEDPLQRIIMSAHAYWYTYDAAQMDAAVQSVTSAGIPVILGEIANVQDATGACSHVITTYKDLLQSCQTRGAGWLAWTWTDDMCPDRRMTSDGQFGNLTGFGNTVVNDANFGLKTHAQKACFDMGTYVIESKTVVAAATLSPNPADKESLIICTFQQADQPSVITLQDLSGRQLQRWDIPLQTAASQVLHVPLRPDAVLTAGLYFVHIHTGTTHTALRLLIR